MSEAEDMFKRKYRKPKQEFFTDDTMYAIDMKYDAVRQWKDAKLLLRENKFGRKPRWRSS